MKRKTITTLATLILASLSILAETKIDIRNGVPTITADSRTVRPRMFYGSANTRLPLEMKAEAISELKLPFTSAADFDNPHARFNFSHDADEIEVLSIWLESNGAKETVFDKNTPLQKIRYNANKNVKISQKDGALYISKKPRDPQAADLKFTVALPKIRKGAQYSLNFKIKPRSACGMDAVVFNASPFAIIAQSGKKSLEEQIKLAKAAGVNFVTFGVPCYWSDGDMEKNRDKIDSMIKDAVAANPNILIIPRLGANPPKEWLEAHPDDVFTNFDGKPVFAKNQTFASIASETYRRELVKALARTIEHLEKNYKRNMGGYHPAGASTGEWLYPGMECEGMADYSKASLNAWRKWLENKYSTVENLNSAHSANWKDFKSVQLPTPEQRLNTNWLLNPQTDSAVIDLNLFLQDKMAETVLLCAETAKKIAPDKLALAFYGYGFEMSGTDKSPAYSGHYALRKVLNSPYVDIVVGPISYTDRQLGGSKCVMSPAESIAMSGKMWLDEDDTRTYRLWRSTARILCPDNLQQTREDSLKVLNRNLSQQILKNNGCWWMDLFGGGWFADKKLWDLMKKYENAENDFLAEPQKYQPDVALVYDEKSMCHIAAKGKSQRTSARSLVNGRMELNRSGMPFGQYLLDDIADGKVKTRLNIFLAAYALDKKQREKLSQISKQTSSIWVWAAGYIDESGKKFSFDAMRETSGFKIEDAGDVELFVTPTEEGKKIGLKPFGQNKKISPAPAVVCEDGDIVLARYSNGKAAVVARKNGEAFSVFCGTVNVPRELAMYAAEMSGIHIYTKSPASVFKNKNYFSVCAMSDGKYAFDLKTDKKVYDALSGEKISDSGKFELNLKKGDSIILKTDN